MTKAEIDMCLNCARIACDSGNCARIQLFRRREAKAIYVDGRRVTVRELASMCHKSDKAISDCIKRGWTGDQIVKYYSSRASAPSDSATSPCDDPEDRHGAAAARAKARGRQCGTGGRK